MSLAIPAIFSLPNLDPTLALRSLFLDTINCAGTKIAYAQALGEFFEVVNANGTSISRPVFMRYRSSLIERKLSVSTINLRLSAVRGLIREVRKNNFIDAETAEQLTSVPNLPQNGTRRGNWLEREQAESLLAVPDRSRLKGKRDFAILAVLLGCALRREELAKLDIKKIQKRKDRWVILDLIGKGRRVRTVAMPESVKNAVDEWTKAAGIKSGLLLRPLSKSDRILGDGLSGWAVWSVVRESARAIGIDNLGAHDLRRTCAKLCRKKGGDLEQIMFMLGHASIKTTQVYLGAEQELSVAVNDGLGF